MTTFIPDLRRVLYVAEMLKTYMEWLRLSDIPTYLKVDLNNVQSSLNRLYSDMQFKTSPETWAKVRSELSSEQINDLALLLDECVDVTPVSEITEVIRESKTVCHEIPTPNA